MSVNINHQLEQVNNLKITTVGTGASVGAAGIVTYYGDGSQLSGINAGGGGSTGVTTDAQGNTYSGELAGGSFSGTDAQYNTLYGYDAGGDITTGDFNTCFGWTAGDKITTGSRNAAFGAEALDYCTIGERNVAVGWEAGRSITDGNRNVCIGDMAGRSLGSASDVIAIGYHAASNFSSSDDVIAIGSNSAFLGGASKIAIGEYSMQKNTDYCIGIGQYTGRYHTGDYSIFMGQYAGQGAYYNGEKGTGGQNIAIGYRALKDCWGAYDNTIIGTRAGIAMTESHSTVAIGVSALKSATTASNNVAIGASVGDSITTGSNNIIIGHNADASSATVSNEITLGNSSITKFRIPGIGVTLKDNGGTPTQGHVLTVDANGEASFAAASGGGGGASEAFKTIAVSGQSDVVADSATDTLTLVAGSNMTITTNASGDSITFASSGGGGSSNVTVRTVHNYTTTDGQTLFPPTGTIGFTSSYVDVFYNGVRLEASEYTENVTGSAGTSITLTIPAGLDDIVDIVAYESVGIASVTVLNDTTPQLGGDLDLNGHNITGTGNINTTGNMNITGIATANGGQLQTEDDVIGIVMALG